MSNNNSILNLESIPKIDYSYKEKYNEAICILLSKPILEELKRRNIKRAEFIRRLNADGLNYTYRGLVQVIKGRNPYVTNFSYFSRLYEYLELPFPSIDYLSSFK